MDRRDAPRTAEPLVEELDRDTALRLLATQTLGRLAISRSDAAPFVVPVTYTLLRESVVFRTAPGTKLRLLVTEPVAFEVDHWDPETDRGWSVVIEGLAYEASDREMEYEKLDLDAVVERQNSRWVRLVPQSINARRVTRVAVKPSDPGHSPGSARSALGGSR